MKRALCVLVILCSFSAVLAAQQGPDWPPSTDQLFHDIGVMVKQIDALQRYITTLQQQIAAQQKEIEALKKSAAPDK